MRHGMPKLFFVNRRMMRRLALNQNLLLLARLTLGASKLTLRKVAMPVLARKGLPW